MGTVPSGTALGPGPSTPAEGRGSSEEAACVLVWQVQKGPQTRGRSVQSWGSRSGGSKGPKPREGESVLGAPVHPRLRGSPGGLGARQRVVLLAVFTKGHGA